MVTKTIYHVALEPVSTRYTGQWYEHMGKDITRHAHLLGFKGKINVVSVDGEQVENTTTPGAFLDFAATNIWKSTQLATIATLFQSKQVKPGDVFLYTDFWNPSVLQLKYMSELFGIPVKIIGIAHAGSYDPQDFLGRLIGDKPWVRTTELALFHTFDKLIFATRFHLELFANTFGIALDDPKLVRSGFPMEYFVDILKPYDNLPKRNLILFPHRLAPEKQVEIFKDLAKSRPQYEWVICQDKKLTKDEYHTLLGESKIVFSANLQETLGISSCIEGPLTNSFPLVPDRLSYEEIFDQHPAFTYPSKWTKDFDSYLKYKHLLLSRIDKIMEKDLKEYKPTLDKLKETIIHDYINPNIMMKELFK